MSIFSYHYGASLPFSAKEARIQEDGPKNVRFVYTSDLKGIFKTLNEKGMVSIKYSPFTFCDWAGTPHASCECEITEPLTGYSAVGFGEVCPGTLTSDIARNYLLCQCRDIAFSRAMIDFLDIGGTKVLSTAEMYISKDDITNQDAALAKPINWDESIAAYKKALLEKQEG